MKIMTTVSKDYKLEDAALGLEKTFEVTQEVLLFIARTMDAVETIGTLSGTQKKLAVFDMARGVIENFDKIESTLSILVDTIKDIYKFVKEKVKAIFGN